MSIRLICHKGKTGTLIITDFNNNRSFNNKQFIISPSFKNKNEVINMEFLIFIPITLLLTFIAFICSYCPRSGSANPPRMYIPKPIKKN